MRPGEAELVRRIHNEVADYYDEEIELELDDREASEAFGDPVHLPDGAEQDSRRHYFRELFRLQGELVRLQSWVAATGHKPVLP